jgi:DNA-binding response OmpR family regulator
LLKNEELSVIASGFILVVEDEKPIRELLRAALEDVGFDVATAATSDEAVASFAKLGTLCDAVVTDVNLGDGKRSGWHVARQVRELNVNIPIVYMTGDSGRDWPSMGVANSRLITKPFAPAQIVAVVAQLLNERDIRGG